MGLLADLVVSVMNFYTQWLVHFDLFNLGVIGGKLLLVPMSLYFNGILFYQNWIDAVLMLAQAIFEAATS